MSPFEGNRPKLRTLLLALVAVVVVAVTLYRVPLATVFTLGVLLMICPLLMIGMHGGGHSGAHSAHNGIGVSGRTARARPSSRAHALGACVPGSDP